MSSRLHQNSADRHLRAVPSRAECPADSPAPSPPFWGRFIRALTLVIVAANAHLWLVRAPGALDPQGTPAVAHAGIAPAVQHLAGARPEDSTPPELAAAVPQQAPDRVTVVTKFLPVPRTNDQPVGTSGFLRAAAATTRLRDEARQLIAAVTRSTPSDSVPEAPAAGHVASGSPAPESAPAFVPTASVARQPEFATPESPLTITTLASGPTLPANIPPPDAPRPASSTTAAPIVRTPPIVEPDQKQLVLRVLDQYAAAYKRLDAAAAKAVWPTVNDTALRRAFNQLEEQSVTFQSCGVTISGRDANAHCRGEASYRPRVGPRTLQREPREWTFDLSKANEAWQIMKATVR